MADLKTQNKRLSNIRKIEIAGKMCKGEKIEALNLQPERGEAEYREALVLEKIPKQHAKWDLAQQGPECEVIASRRELQMANAFLQKQRTIGNIFHRKQGEGWKILTNHENELNSNFCRYNKLLKENGEKVERAKNKKIGEYEKQNDIRAEVNELKKSLDYYKAVKQSMKQQISIYKMYEVFLNRIVESSTKFSSIEEACNMFEALQSARETVSIRETEGGAIMQKMAQEMIQIVSEKANAILDINSKMKTLDSDYDKAKQLTHHWESILANTKTMVLEKIQEVYMIKQMSWDLYLHCCKLSEQQPVLGKDELEQQLYVISSYINHQKMVLERAKQSQIEQEPKKPKKSKATG